VVAWERVIEDMDATQHSGCDTAGFTSVDGVENPERGVDRPRCRRRRSSGGRPAQRQPGRRGRMTARFSRGGRARSGRRSADLLRRSLPARCRNVPADGHGRGSEEGGRCSSSSCRARPATRRRERRRDRSGRLPRGGAGRLPPRRDRRPDRARFRRHLHHVAPSPRRPRHGRRVGGGDGFAEQMDSLHDVPPRFLGLRDRVSGRPDRGERAGPRRGPAPSAVSTSEGRSRPHRP
jgi:hypothetical protein